MTQQTEDLLMEGEVSLADLENSSNPVLERIKNRLLKSDDESRLQATKSHPSHSSSPGGKGHNSYVTGRFEDSGQ